MKSRTLKYSIAAIIVLLICLDIGAAGSEDFDLYAILNKYSHFIYGRYNLGERGEISSGFCDREGVERGYWLPDDAGSLIGPFSKLLTDTAGNDTDLWVSLDRRYPISHAPSLAGDLITYCLDIKASLDSAGSGDDTVASVYLRWFSGEGGIRERPLANIMTHDFSEDRLSRSLIIWFDLSAKSLGDDFRGDSMKIQLALMAKGKCRLIIDWIKICDQAGFALVECPEYLKAIQDYLPMKYEIEGKKVAVYPGPEYPVAYMIMTGEFEKILRDYRCGSRMKLRSWENIGFREQL